MRIVTANQLQLWLDQSEVLEKDGRGPKVLRLQEGQLLKIFRPRRRIWLARLKPQAERFGINATRLKSLGIPAPQVSENLWIDPGSAVSACLYSPLAGESIDKLYYRDRATFEAQLRELAAFVSELHAKGVYFRSLHLGNILRLPEGCYGLIDFLDIRFKRSALSPRLVRRNLMHLHSYLQRSKITDFPWAAFNDAYLQSTVAR